MLHIERMLSKSHIECRNNTHGYVTCPCSTKNSSFPSYKTEPLCFGSLSIVPLQVQVIGSVVYSKYSVKVKVMPSPPVAFIQGGTNIFINNRNTTLVVLDGQKSYDPDFPLNPLR